MSTSELEQLCTDAGLNVHAVSIGASHLIAQVGKDKRSSQTVIARLRRLARDRDLPIGGIVYSQSPVRDDEIWFGVKA